MTPETLNFLLPHFLGRFCARLLYRLQNLRRRLTWTLATVWSIAMFSEGILQSGYLLDPAFPPHIQTKSADDL